MTAVDLPPRLAAIGLVLAQEMPLVLERAVSLLESMAHALDATRPERYEIHRQIGAGGQAEVFLGTFHGAQGFERPVAIKRARSEAMLIEEAHLTARLSHPNVIAVVDLIRDRAGRLLLVMEHVDGIDLAQLTKSGPVPYSVTIFIVRELFAALGHIHEHRREGRVRGVVHRDVAPDNVLLSRDGAVKLADFGVARELVVTMTGPSGNPMGKPGYMSPEQARDEGLDGRSDLYAVGILLWELLVSRRLHVGLAGDAATAVTYQAIPRPSACRPGVPLDLEAVVMRLLAIDREERYQTAELAAHDLALCRDASRDGRAELARLLADRFPPGRAPRRSSDVPITVAMADIPAPAPAPPAPISGSRTDITWRWRWLAIGLLLALVLVLATAIVLLGR